MLPAIQDSLLAETFIQNTELFPANENTQQIGADILSTAALFNVTFHMWSNRRQADTTPKDKFASVKAAERLRSTMTLIKSPAYDAIKNYLAESRKWFLARSMPSFMMKGIFFVKLDQVSAFEIKVKEVQEWLDTIGVPALIADYTRAKYESRLDYEEIAADLGIQCLFNETEYPSSAKLAGAFGISHNWVAFSVPENLPAEIREQEAAKLTQQYEEAREEITTALRQMFAELVTHATDRLTVQPGEKQKIFRESLVDNFKEFFNTFGARDMTDDRELQKLVAQARSIMGNVSVTTLRENLSIRDSVATKLTGIKEAVDQLIVTAPSRKFRLEDGD